MRMVVLLRGCTRERGREGRGGDQTVLGLQILGNLVSTSLVGRFWGSGRGLRVWGVG